MDNLVIFLSICLRRNIHCDPLLGPSCTDGSKEGSQLTFLLRDNKIIFKFYPFVSGAMYL